MILMLVTADISAWKQTKWYEYTIRFLLGGMITATAGVIANKFGPVIGGLFLAFPAIFPASATLIEKHERERKAKKGLSGTSRAREAAAASAAGAAMGCIGLLAFACYISWLLPSHRPVSVVAGATGSWAILSGLMWLLWKRNLFSRLRIAITGVRHSTGS